MMYLEKLLALQKKMWVEQATEHLQHTENKDTRQNKEWQSLCHKTVGLVGNIND